VCVRVGVTHLYITARYLVLLLFTILLPIELSVTGMPLLY
jgi:hypothetical protein